MAWEVEYTDEFEAWWLGLDEEEQIDIDAVVGLLEKKSPPAISLQLGSQGDQIWDFKGAENSAQGETLQNHICL